MATKIEWTDETWNPVTGCTKVSAGCKNCYAERMSKRLAGRYGYPPAPDNFKVTLHPARLDQPLRWRKPRRVFVCSMSDFFHPHIPLGFQAEMLSIMRRCPQHTFQILTKRTEQLALFDKVCGWSDDLPNVWLGVSAENQETANERVPVLFQIPAAVRFVSCEPLLGPIDFGFMGTAPKTWTANGGCRPVWSFCHWVIAGGESGPNARPIHPGWVRSIRDQCQEADVPFFFKQWGEYVPTGSDLAPTHFADGQGMFRVGKKAAGRLLDGRVWAEFP